MKISQAGKMAFAAVLSNKLRSFLTMLGIIIGVMSVTLLISLVQGATNTVTESLDEMGGDQLIVSISDTSKRLKLNEIKALEGANGISLVSPAVSGKSTAKADGNAIDVSVTGITAAYDEVQGLDLELGRNINEIDNEYRLDVCIIGQEVASELFGSTAVLNESIRLSGKDYRIVGVLEEGEETIMGNTNTAVYIPFTNAQRLFSSVAISSFYVMSSSEDEIETAKKTLESVLMDKYGNEDSYSIVNMSDMAEIIDTIMGTLELLLGAIAGISLLVGGIGIMNIMLVSVTERTREIGIRKAIGALKSDIIVQFMIESVIISMMGGVIGMLISQGVLSTINALFPDYHFAITGGVAAIALGFSMAVGVVFGIYPANKAAKLKPINALRYE